MDARLLDYYNRELRYLRELGGEFARDFPKIAGRLGLDSFACADPYVERLLEGFAFLAARVQLKVDDEFPRFSEQLLGLVCPHYLGPMPSMAVVELLHDERQGSLSDGFVLPRGTSLRATLQRPRATCEYRTGQEVTLWPIEVAALTLTPAVGGPELRAISTRSPKATARLRLRTTNGLPFARLSVDELLLFFRGSDFVTWRLFEAIAGGTLGVSTLDPRAGGPVRLDEARVRPVGCEDECALLPVGARAFQGYRLLSEYFAFPQRFLFARVTGLARGVRACQGTELDVVFALDRYDAALESAASPSMVSLSACPAVNLFPKRADRVQLTDSDHEYHVVPDRSHPMDFEVHTVLAVQGCGAKGEFVREFSPFYRRRHGASSDEQSGFYTVQRRDRLSSARQLTQGTRSGYLGGEVYLALVDGRHGPYDSDLTQLSVDTLCTNRDLPLMMAVGQGTTDFILESGAPVKSVRCLAGPTPPRTSHAVGETSWRLISQLSLNYLGMADTSPEEGACALRELLSLYADLADPSSARQIAGVRSTRTRPIVRRLPGEGPPSFVRGFEVSLECDETSFEGTSAFVLGFVLSRFFARYASINSFTETVVRTTQRGEIARWPMTPGMRAGL